MLRIAVSTKVPPLLTHDWQRQRAAVEESVALLRELGHQVVMRDPDYPSTAMAHALSRYFRGAYDDVQTLPHPERLEPRTREFARIGGLISDQRMTRIRAAESQMAERIQSIYDEWSRHNPRHSVGPSRSGLPAARRDLDGDVFAPRVPFQALFNGRVSPPPSSHGARRKRGTDVDPVVAGRSTRRRCVAERPDRESATVGGRRPTVSF